MDLERARELFHLNHTEAALITHLLPRQQVLLKRPDLSKVRQPPRRPGVVLDLHQHAAGQRAPRRRLTASGTLSDAVRRLSARDRKGDLAMRRIVLALIVVIAARGRCPPPRRARGT